MAVFAVLLTACLVWANYLLHRDVMYPGFLQASLWFAAFALLALTQGVFIPVADRTLLILLVGVMLFSMGAFLGSYSHTPYLARNYVREGTLPTGWAVGLLATIVAFGLLLYVRRAQELASSGPSDNSFVNLRYAVSIAQDETGGFGVAQYFLLPAYVLVGIAVLRRRGFATPTVPRVAFGVALLIGVAFGLLSSGRGPVLALVIVVLAIPTVLRATTPTRAATVLVTLFLVLFAVVGLALGKGGTLGSSIGENWSTMRESLLTYVLGGIPSLNTFLSSRGPDLDGGLNSFRSVVAVLHALGFQVTAAPLVQPYVDIPMPMNIYTVHQPYIKDFGALGGALALFVLGFVHSVLYRRATVRTPHAMWVFLFALSLFPLVMQVFQDMYFSLLSMWVQYGTYAALFFVILSERYWTHFSNRLARDLGPIRRHA
jgi:oligosaccharide repeat unit polymerase